MKKLVILMLCALPLWSSAQVTLTPTSGQGWLAALDEAGLDDQIYDQDFLVRVLTDRYRLPHAGISYALIPSDLYRATLVESTIRWNGGNTSNQRRCRAEVAQIALDQKRGWSLLEAEGLQRESWLDSYRRGALAGNTAMATASGAGPKISYGRMMVTDWGNRTDWHRYMDLLQVKGWTVMVDTSGEVYVYFPRQDGMLLTRFTSMLGDNWVQARQRAAYAAQRVRAEGQ